LTILVSFAIDTQRKKSQGLENVSIELDKVTAPDNSARTVYFPDHGAPDIRVIEYLNPSHGVSCRQPTIMWLCNEKRASSSKIECEEGDRHIQKRIKSSVMFRLNLPPHSLKHYDGGVVLIQLGYKRYPDSFWCEIAQSLVCIVQKSEVVKEYLANQIRNYYN